MSDDNQRLFFYCQLCAELYVGGVFCGLRDGMRQTETRCCNKHLKLVAHLVGDMVQNIFMPAHDVLWAAYVVGGPAAAVAIWEARRRDPDFYSDFVSD